MIQYIIDFYFTNLSIMGLGGLELQFFKSYLENRTHKTYRNNVLSTSAVCNTGVAQGGILSPLLFIIFINDLFYLETNCEIFSYADDTTIMHANNK